MKNHSRRHRKTNKISVSIKSTLIYNITFFSENRTFLFSRVEYQVHAKHNNQHQNYYNHWQYDDYWWLSICLFITEIDGTNINKPNTILKYTCNVVMIFKVHVVTILSLIFKRPCPYKYPLQLVLIVRKWVPFWTYNKVFSLLLGVNAGP